MPRNGLFQAKTLAIAALLLSAPVFAAKPGTFDYQSITLDNGLQVITLEDFSCPIVVVQLWYHVGSKNEDPNRQGFAHMFEHMMFRGTDRLGPTDHFDYVRRTGGSCNAYTTFDQTVYHEELPANQLELALWLEAERMAFLKIDQESFDTERKVVEEERRLGANRPYGTMMEKMLAALYKVHPYRWSTIGNIPHLRASEVRELRDFWTRNYVPNNATLVIVGAVKHEKAQELAKQAFGWIPRYPDPARVTIREPIPDKKQSVVIKEDNAPAPLVGILYHTVPIADDDAPALDLLATIVGGGESSRIYRELVAEKELAPFAGAFAFSLEQDGLFAVAAALPPFGGDADKVLAALAAHVDRLRNEPVSEHELTKARNQILRGMVTENLTISSKASTLGSAAVLEGDVAAVNKRYDQIAALTADDLQRVAQKYLVPEHAIEGRVERNLLGSIGSLFWKSKGEDEAPITAKPETDPPAPGRPGLKRPDTFAATPPSADRLEYDPTPKYETVTLDNGLKVMVVENHEVPYVTVRLGLLAGAWTEEKPGTSASALGMLTKGTELHDEGALADELETYAVSLSGNAGMDNSSVSASCLTQETDRAVRLLAEVVRTPTFPADEFKKLCKQAITGLTIQTNDPGYQADRQMRERLYGTHPYARSVTGEMEDVQALKVEDAKAWWSRFARPDMSTLIFAGDVNLDQAKKLAQQYFGDWKAEGEKPDLKVPEIPERSDTHIYLVDYPGMQSQIRVAQRGITRDDPNYFTSRVVSGYFGGAFSSRLNETIRVKKGLTYGARGGFGAQRMAGDFSISTFSKTASTVEAVKAILDEIERLKNEPPTADELDKTISYTLGSFPGDRETPQSVAGDLWFIESQNLPADYFEQMLKAVAGTSAEDCTKLVAKVVDAAKMVIVVAGPAAELEKDLSEIAPVTVVHPGETPVEKPAAPDA